MKISEIIRVVDAEVLTGSDNLEAEVAHGFASDLMSDVLTLNTTDVIIITGLANVQAVRTAEMSDIPVLLFVRNKEISEDIVALGRELGLTLLRTKYSMFKTSGLLYSLGLKPIF